MQSNLNTHLSNISFFGRTLMSMHVYTRTFGQALWQPYAGIDDLQFVISPPAEIVDRYVDSTKSQKVKQAHLLLLWLYSSVVTSSTSANKRKSTLFYVWSLLVKLFTIVIYYKENFHLSDGARGCVSRLWRHIIATIQFNSVVIN